MRADDEDEQQGEKVVDSCELDSLRKVKDVDPASNARTQISIDRSESTLSDRTHHKTRTAGRDFDRTARKFDCSVCRFLETLGARPHLSERLDQSAYAGTS